MSENLTGQKKLFHVKHQEIDPDKYLIQREDGWHVRFFAADGSELEGDEAYPTREQALKRLGHIFRWMHMINQPGFHPDDLKKPLQ